MTSGNFDETPPPQPVAPAANDGFRMPAEYYSGPAPRRAFPKGVTYGCGAASVLFLLVLFIGGAYLATGGMAQFMDMAVGMSLGEMRGMYTAQVTPAQKSALDAEIEKLRQGVREEKINVAKLQPFMKELGEAIGDKKVSPEEAETLTRIARDAQKRTPAH
jgi:heme exporter protein D